MKKFFVYSLVFFLSILGVTLKADLAEFLLIPQELVHVFMALLMILSVYRLVTTEFKKPAPRITILPPEEVVLPPKLATPIVNLVRRNISGEYDKTKQDAPWS